MMEGHNCKHFRFVIFTFHPKTAASSGSKWKYQKHNQETKTMEKTKTAYTPQQFHLLSLGRAQGAPSDRCLHQRRSQEVDFWNVRGERLLKFQNLFKIQKKISGNLTFIGGLSPCQPLASAPGLHLLRRSLLVCLHCRTNTGFEETSAAEGKPRPMLRRSGEP
jgi:hypothetical protein